MQRRIDAKKKWFGNTKGTFFEWCDPVGVEAPVENVVLAGIFVGEGGGRADAGDAGGEVG